MFNPRWSFVLIGGLSLLCSLFYSLAQPAHASIVPGNGLVSSDSFGIPTLLPKGNVVIGDSTYDTSVRASDVGAGYLYNGAIGVLINLLTGSKASDQVGNTDVIALINGSYVVRSNTWGNGSATNAELASTTVGSITAVNSIRSNLANSGSIPSFGYDAVNKQLGVSRLGENIVALWGITTSYPLITVATTGAGRGIVTSIPAGIHCGVTCTMDFAYGTGVTLTATTDSGSAFSGWSGACSGTGSCTLPMKATQQVTATFALTNLHTTLTLITTPNPAAIAEPIIITATLTPTGGTGAIQFYADGAPFGATVSITADVAAITTTLPAGTSVITATYTGAGFYLPSTSNQVSQLVAGNSAPKLTNLTGNLFIEDSSAVVIDSDVTVADFQLDALNGGNGNYAGATLLIAREGGASREDSFSNYGTLGTLVAGQALLANSLTVGTVITNADGTLGLTFNSAATTAVVNDVLRSITYRNAADLPLASIRLEWTFRDEVGGTASAVNPLRFAESTGSDNPLGGINVGWNSAPTFVDIDGDGDQDAFVGAEDGMLYYYRNVGTAHAPTFLAVTGSDNPLDGVDVGSTSIPAFVDIDNDGKPDLFIGEDGGSIFFYHNTGTANAPAFTPVTGSSNPFDGITVGFNSAPAFVDIDGDGDQDAFIGNPGNGTLAFYRNIGSASVASFTAVTGSSNPFDGLTTPSLPKLSFADIDGDGDQDVFVGTLHGFILFYRNSGSHTTPRFTLMSNDDDPFRGLGWPFRSTPTFVDIDGDDDFDAFIGHAGGGVSFQHNDTSQLPGALMTITAHNDDPLLSGLPLMLTVMQNLTTTLELSPLTFDDPDAATNPITLIISATTGSLLAGDSGGVTVAGSGTAMLILSGTAVDINTYLPTGNLLYLPALDATGITTLTLIANDGGNSGAGGGSDVTLGSVLVNITPPPNAAPTLSNLTRNIYTEDGSAVVIDDDVTVADAELDARNSGNGDYGGATLTIKRDGGANTQDWFGSSGQLEPLVAGQPLAYNSIAIGTVITNTAGTLGLTFNSTTTTTLVNEVLQRITYSNTADAPPASVTLDWTFRDEIGDKAAAPLHFTEVTDSDNPFDGIDVGYDSAPSFVDIDGDGDQDAFVGEFEGTIRYYRNVGTAYAPTFLAVTGSDHPLDGVDVGDASEPTFVDIDNDGKPDLFMGEVGGSIFFFHNTGTANVPVFTAVTGSRNPLDGITVGSNSAPTFVDIDGDGDQDAFIGTQSSSTIFFYRNTGSASVASFTAVTGRSNPFDGLYGFTSSKPTFADIDRDGDRDAFVGNFFGTMVFYRNSGNQTTPRFTEITGSANPFDGVGTGFRNAPTLADIDGDGNQDALIGNYSGTIRFFRNETSQLPGALMAITAINDDPLASGLPLTLTVVQNLTETLDLSPLIFGDPDAITNTVTLTISTAMGTLTASSSNGVTIAGSGTAVLTLSGMAGDIDTYLNTASNLQYTTALNATGITTLTLTANDGGHTGTGGGIDITLGSVTTNITENPTPTPTVTPTASATTTEVATATLTATPTATPTETSTPTATALNTPIASPTTLSTPTATVTATATQTAMPTATDTTTAVSTATATATPISTATTTVTETPTSTDTSTPVPTSTPTATATVTGTLPATTTVTNTPAATPLPTATSTVTLTPTETATSTATLTDMGTPLPTVTQTSTAMPTGTLLPTATATVTPTPMSTTTVTGTPPATATDTATPTATATVTPTVIATQTPTSTGTATATATDVPTATSTATATATDVPTVTSIPTATSTDLPTSTNTPTATATDISTATSTATPTDTPVPTATDMATPITTATDEPTVTSTVTATNMPTATSTPTEIPIPTVTAMSTATDVPTLTSTPTGTTTALPTMTSTPTETATAINTATPTEAGTLAPTNTPTVTNTPEATATETAAPTEIPTLTVTPTATALPTATDIPTNVPTASVTPTPSATVTVMPTHTPTATGTSEPTATSTPTASTTQVNLLAVNDAAGTLQGEAVIITPLNNDQASASGALSVMGVTMPTHGTAMIRNDEQSIAYTPNANFSGLDAFQYTVHHSSGVTATASIAIVVSAKADSAAPIVVPIDVTAAITTSFSGDSYHVVIHVPKGAYTGTLSPTDVFYIAYTPIVTPTANVWTPPVGGLQFGELLFTLNAFINDIRLESYHFPEPLTLTLGYAGKGEGLKPQSLQLYYWAGDHWASDGIEFVSRDEVMQTITYHVTHFTEFVLFGTLRPTALEETREPDVERRLYLPLVLH